MPLPQNTPEALRDLIADEREAGRAFGPLAEAARDELALRRAGLSSAPRCAVCGGPDAAGNGCEYCPAVDA